MTGLPHSDPAKTVGPGGNDAATTDGNAGPPKTCFPSDRNGFNKSFDCSDSAPEIIRRVRPSDSTNADDLARVLHDLAAENVIRIYRPLIGNDWLIAVNGPRQLDELAARARKDYSASISIEPVGLELARRPFSHNEKALMRFVAANRPMLAKDLDGTIVFLAVSPWELERVQRDWPDIEFRITTAKG